MDALIQDLRYALRRIVGTPLLSVVVGGVEAFAPEVALGLGTVALLMLAVGLLSSWLPARRGSSVDPVQILRAE